MDRKAEAQWNGDLKSGNGTFSVGSKAFTLPYSFVSRFEGSGDTNPEELIGAAIASCFSMALSHALAQTGHTPTSVHTEATVSINKGDAGFAVSGILLTTRGVVSGVSAEEFQAAVEKGCIIARALSAVPITYDAQLLG